MLFAILPSSEHADHKAWRGASGQGLPTPPSGLRPRQLPFLPPPHRVRAGHPPALLALPPLLWLPLRLLCPLLKLPYPQDSSYAALGICPGRPGSLYRAPRLGEVASCASKCASSPRFPPRCDFPFTRRPPPLPVLWAMIFWHRGFVIFIPASQAYLALQSMFLIYIGPTHARSRRLYEGKSK